MFLIKHFYFLLKHILLQQIIRSCSLSPVRKYIENRGIKLSGWEIPFKYFAAFLECPAYTRTANLQKWSKNCPAQKRRFSPPLSATRVKRAINSGKQILWAPPIITMGLGGAHWVGTLLNYLYFDRWTGAPPSPPQGHRVPWQGVIWALEKGSV